jgi:hypothetical protein
MGVVSPCRPRVTPRAVGARGPAFDPDIVIPVLVGRFGPNDPETVKLTGIHRHPMRSGREAHSSLGAIPGMLYCNRVSGRTDTPVEAVAGMKWFRSNVRLGSQLALFALAIQFLLAFGHFHGSAQAASASPDAMRSGLHDVVGFAARHLGAGHEPAGQPADDCAICAVMALASAMVDAAPPCLPTPRAAAFAYLPTETGFLDPNSARVAFQPRAPPIA